MLPPLVFVYLVLFLILAFLFYYFLEVVEKPVLQFSEGEFVKSVLANCPRLTRKYFPTFWCFNNHLMLALLLFREHRSKFFHYDKLEHLKMKDGGVTGLAWSNIKEKKKTDSDPIAIVFHTISGDEQDVKSIVKAIGSQLKWASVVCIRRGHGNLPLPKPQINTMGSSSDLKEQLLYIKKKFPNSPLFGVGISAGSGLLARYLGESGTKSLLDAAVAISPAYDIEKAFHRVHPVYSKIMGQRLINYFLKRHYETLSSLGGFQEVMESKTLGEFQDRLHTLSGFDDKEEYYRYSNPALVMKNIRTPIMILNAKDDPICVNQNVLENLHWLENLPNSIHVYTKRGSHIAYFEGWKAISWSDHLVCEYFKAVQDRLPKKKKKPKTKPAKKR